MFAVPRLAPTRRTCGASVDCEACGAFGVCTPAHTKPGVRRHTS
ncbi:hypothetical protein I551_3638 [Mycobacterium ulcerans str. Harvey]|uniref:Uncharacterized protein n=1 Tax=Mycobacterium ulcerans str. Harvey TaxID=1299332 RepID=A0ABP3AJ36_MYCUL|nr:hypothetical protein I551_3638 [Mycobacterium ulcerans str. Harvey]